MALESVLKGLATEASMRRLLNLLTFARTPGDVLRVSIDQGTVTQLNAIIWGNQSSYPTWYGTGSPNSMDLREQQKSAQRAVIQQQRATRWLIT